MIFECRVGLVDALLKKIDAAESRGEYQVDLTSPTRVESAPYGSPKLTIRTRVPLRQSEW